MEDMKKVEGWLWHIGSCACGVNNVPVARSEHHTNCTNCLRKVADELDTTVAGMKSGAEHVEGSLLTTDKPK